jgi:branched-chain amino acid transport system substrate-binding protein
MMAKGEMASGRAAGATGTGLVRAARAGLAGLATLALAACVTPFGGDGGDPFAAAPPTVAGEPLSEGSVPVALLLPLGGQGQGQQAAVDLRNAARLALSEFREPDLAVTVYDTRGTPAGASAAAAAAVAAGAELIVGPLFAGSVQAAGEVARPANVPILAFSTDATVARSGVYLMGFLPQPEVERVVDYAAQNGRRAVAALIPQTTYGNVVEAQFRETAARRGVRVVQVERYPAGQPQQAVARLAGVATGASPQVDALFVPDDPTGLAAVSAALQGAGFDPARVKPLGTALWNDPGALRLPMLQGGWFAAPEQTGFQNFAARYQAAYNEAPVRIASLAYDAVSLAAALNRTQGTQRFSETVLTNRAGFNGVDGVFRFRADGLNDRALAVYEARDGAAAVVSPSPRSLPDA